MSDKIRPMTSRRPYLLRALYEWILDNQCSPFLLVDTTVEGVQVPMQHIEDNKIVLNMSPSAIRGFEIADDGVYFGARFSGVSMNIIVPMDAVLALYARENGEGMIFGPPVLDEVKDIDSTTIVPASVPDAEPVKSPAPVGLRAVDNSKVGEKGRSEADKDGGDDPDSPPDAPTPGKGKPKLRVVK